MAWIKRNLYFLIGGIVALALLGAAVFYLVTKNQMNSELSEKLDAAYGELTQLNQQNPHPGNSKVDNIKIAKEQSGRLAGYVARADQFFGSIPSIPDSGEITDAIFAAQLSKTIVELQTAATAASVTLPPRYDFSFSAIKSKMAFATGSLHPLAEQLGEVKAICDVLYRAKINALDSIRRRRVSPDDRELADYTEQPATTNELAVLTPYEVTFRCFSGELAEVLRGFAYSPNGFIVKTVSIDPASALAVAPEAQAAVPSTIFAESLRRRSPFEPGIMAPPVVQPIAPVTPAGRGGLQTFLNERPLRVNLVIELVKLKKSAK